MMSTQKHGEWQEDLAKEKRELQGLVNRYQHDPQFYRKVNYVTSLLLKLTDMEYHSEELEAITKVALHRLRELNLHRITKE